MRALAILHRAHGHFLQATRSPLFSILASRFGLSGAGFVSGVLIANILGAATLGEYSYIIASASIIAVFFSLGAEVPYNIHSARNASATFNFISMAYGHAIMSSIIFCIIWIALSYLGISPFRFPMLVTAAVFALMINQFVYAIAAGAQKQVQVNLTIAFLIIAMPVIIHFLIALGIDSLPSAVIGYTISFTAAGAIAFLSFYGRRDKTFSYRSSYSQIALEGRHNLVANISGIIRLRAPIIVLSAYVPSASVGIYQVSQTLTELLYIVPVAISTAILSLKPQGSQLIKDSLRYSLVSVTLTSLAAFAFIILMGFIVPLLYGDDFASVTGYARIMLLGTIAFAISKPLSAYLYKTGRGGLTARMELGALGAFLVVSPISISQWGIVGAAWSFVITAWLPAAGYTIVVASQVRGSSKAPAD